MQKIKKNNLQKINTTMEKEGFVSGTSFRNFNRADGFNNVDGFNNADGDGIKTAAAAACAAGGIPPGACSSAISFVTGGGSSGNPAVDAACKKPGPFANGAHWKAYNECKGKVLGAPESFSWPPESEFPQSAWNTLIDNPNATKADLESALQFAHNLATDYQRQTDVHTAAGKTSEAQGTIKWRDQANSYVGKLSMKLAGLASNPAPGTPGASKAWGAWQWGGVAAGAALAVTAIILGIRHFSKGKGHGAPAAA